MKSNSIYVCLSIFLSVLFTNCDKEKIPYEYFTVASPITMSQDEFRAATRVSQPTTMIESGKIYAYQNYIFINDKNRGIHVIDNRNPNSPKKINFLNIPLNKDISIKNNYLYADSGKDIVVFDITNIDAIQFINRIENVLENYIEYPDNVDYYEWKNTNLNEKIIIGWDIKIERRIAPKVSTETFFNTSENFVQAADTGTGGSLARFKIVSNYLYAVDSYKINVFNIDKLTEPSKINEVNIRWGAETIFQKDNYLFIGTQTGMFIYDISEPSNPQYVSSIDHFRSCDPVVVDDTYAYVTLRAGGPICSVETLTSRLEIIDISDISNPSIKEIYTLDEPYGLGIKNNLLFICDGQSGLKVYDKTSISDLQRIHHFENVVAYDVIPLNDILLLIGNNKLSQYRYTENGINLLSEFILQ